MLSDISEFEHEKILEQSVLSIKHDLNNHLGTISNLIKSGKTEDVLRYLEKINSQLTMNEHGIETGNVELNSILNFNVGKVKKNNIVLNSHIAVPKYMDVDPYDLTIILGNLMDNAIRAVMGIQNQERRIILDIHYDKGILLINVSNAFSEPLHYKKTDEKDIKALISTKEDREQHGIGLKNVEKAVKRYHGCMDFDIDEDKKTFSVFVLLYINK